MKISHVALYTRNLERLKDFYVRYFDGKANEKYENRQKGFSSYFIKFDSDASLEIMTRTEGLIVIPSHELNTGYSHMAFNVGGRSAVDELTARLTADGYAVVSGPRVTGDGYYESCVLDPDGNRVEITCE